MKKLTTTLPLCLCLFAISAQISADSATSSSDMAAKAQSLKLDAQQQLNALKTNPSTTAADTNHVMALQAQKTAADIAVKAHATATEWTDHASLIAQSAQKLNPAPSSDSAVTTQMKPTPTMSSTTKAKTK